MHGTQLTAVAPLHIAEGKHLNERMVTLGGVIDGLVHLRDLLREALQQQQQQTAAAWRSIITTSSACRMSSSRPACEKPLTTTHHELHPRAIQDGQGHTHACHRLRL